MFKEPETWSVISHINKRYSYGKHIRYSDRFFRNWAIDFYKKAQKAAETNAPSIQTDKNKGKDGRKN